MYKKLSMKKFCIIFLCVSFLVCSFTTCIKDNFDFDKWDREVQYDAGFAIPLAYGDLSYTDVEKMNGKSFAHIETGEDGFLSLVYNTTVVSDDVQKKLKMKAQSSGALLNFDSSSPLPVTDPLNTTLNWEITTDFNTSARFKKIIIKEGVCEATIRTNDPSYTGTISGYITFPSIVSEGGQNLSFQFSNKSLSTTEWSLSQTPIILNNYTINFPINYNKVPIQIFIDFDNNTIPNSIDLQLSVTGPSDNSDGNGNGITYKEAWGYFGVNTLIYKNDSVDVQLFKEQEYEIERYWFEDPKISVKYSNSYGVPSDFQFVDLRAFTNNGNEISPQISMFGNTSVLAPYWQTINRPLFPVLFEEGEILVDKNNSNIRQIIVQRPRWIKLIAQAVTNRNTTPAEIIAMNDYISEDSKLKADIKVEFPMWGDIYKFVYKDTSDFELPEFLTKYDPLKRVMLRIDITNGFPAEMIAQAYFLDNNNMIVDSLLETENQMILKEASVNSEGVVTSASRKVTYVTVTAAQINKWKNANVDKIFYKTYANTTDVNPPAHQQLVKIYDSYRVKFNIGVEFDVDIHGNIDTIMNDVDSL